MKRFKNQTEMLAEATQLLKEDREDAEDRATLFDFYNGQETMSEEDAERQGLRNVVNHMLGFDSLNLARIQVESIYTKSSSMFELKLSNVPREYMHLKDPWEKQLQEALNRIIKKSRRFKPEWKSISGEITVQGAASLIFTDQYDWCPRMARVFVPRGTGILASEVAHCVVCDFMTSHELNAALNSALKRKELGYDTHWNIKNLKKCIEMLKGNFGGQPVGTISPTVEPNDEAAETLDMDPTQTGSLRDRIAIYRFYIGNPDKEGNPFDLYIIPRLNQSQQDSFTKNSSSSPDCLFECPEYFDRASEFLHPFFVDCKLGGKTSWHRIMGLGRLNYDSDVEVEEVFSEAISGARENMRRVYQCSSAADWDLLKSWASGDGPANMLPPGVNVADMGRQPNFQHAMTPFQMLLQITRRNASSVIANPGMGSNVDELEINALERQNRNAEAFASRMSDIYECTDALAAEILRRFLSPDILPSDRGYAEIKEFQQFIKEKKIPIAFLRKEVDGKLRNITIQVSRAAGDGNTVKQKMANAAMLQRIHLFPADAQKIILRRITADETGDHDFAEQVVPFQPRRDTNQIVVAATENDTMDKQGILGYIPPLNDDDLDKTHIEEHMRSLQADVQRGKVRPWDEMDLKAFEVKGAHTHAHIERYGMLKENGEEANAMIQALQKIAKEGDNFANNLQQQGEKAKEPMSQKDQANMQIQQANLQHKNRVQNDLVQFREKSLALKSGEKVADISMAARKQANQEINDEHERTMTESDRIAQAQERSQEGAKRAAEREGAQVEPENNPAAIIQ